MVVEVWFLASAAGESGTCGSQEIVIAAETQVISGNCLIGSTNYLGFCFAVILGLKRASGTREGILSEGETGWFLYWLS